MGTSYASMVLSDASLHIKGSPTFFLSAIDFDTGGEVLLLVIALSITSNSEVKIEKNHADVDLIKALLERGVPCIP